VIDRRWLAAAAAPLVVLAGWVATGRRGPERLELPRSQAVDTSTVMVVAALALSGALLYCARHRTRGLVVLGLVLVAIAGFWPIVQENKFSGPVLVGVGNHGLHRNDALALIPAGLGLAVITIAGRRHRAGRRSGRSDHAASTL
jgi:hypothetical protein